MIDLDTSFLILGLVRGSAEGRRLRDWLAHGEPLGVSAIAWAEFLCGPVSEAEARMAARFLGEPIAFGAEHAVRAAALFNGSGRRRGSLVDCMIAAVALESGAALATGNPSDFRRLRADGLDLESR